MEDRRIKYTKLVLKNSLMELMKLKPLNQISITEICKRADVNRNTFYQHYASPYDLFSVVENELLDKLNSAIENEKNIEKLILKICETLKENKEFSEIIFSQADGNQFIKKVLTFAQKIKGFKQSGQSTAVYLKNLYIFIEAGVLAIIKEWVISGFQESPKVLSGTIFSIISVMDNLLLKYNI